MAAFIILVSHQKGGAGKTTLAAHLAVALFNRTAKVAVVDSDPQQSLADWHRRRTEMRPRLDDIELHQVSEWRAASEMRRLRQGFDYVVVDSPPHRELSAKAGLRNADLMVVPVQPSPMDLWATDSILALAKRENTPCLVVLNRMPPRSRLSGRVTEIMNERDLPMAQTRLGNRQAFASSLMDGLGVTEAEPNSLAALEINALCAEIDSLLGADNRAVA
jgi:chromosome partitioning protein